MNNEPMVSVVMSVYNGEKYLAEAIESVIVQSYRNFEFIIIDDGSNDQSRKILESYARKDSRLRIVSRENRGLAASLNEAISLAKGQWVARMDADDISLPDRIAMQLSWLDATNADVCGGWVRLFGASNWRTRRYEKNDDSIKLQLCFRTAFAHPAVMIRTSLVKKIPYNENVQRGQDYDLWVRFALAGARMTNLQHNVLRYRIHPFQVEKIHWHDTLAHYEIVQQKYVEKMVDWPDAHVEMKKFSFPSNAPSKEDARLLMDIILSIDWASPKAKLLCFATALRYVRPQCHDLYRLYATMRRKLNLKPGFEAVPLWAQSVFGLSTETKVYKILKRFI